MKELLRLAGDGARNHLFGGRGLDNLKNDVSYFCDLTSDRIQGWRDEGRRTGEFVSDALRGGSLARGCLGMVGDWGGLGAGAFLSLAGISRGGGTKAGSLRPSIKYGHHYPSGRVVSANGNRSGVANDNALRQTVKQQKVVGESPSASSSFQFVKGPGKPGQPSSRLTLKMSNAKGQGTGQTLKIQAGKASGGGTSFKQEKIAAKPPLNAKKLLPGEGKVGTYGKLDKMGRKGDNLTPNHMPQNAYMSEYGVATRDGVAMMMEQPTPGTGGRHRKTRTYGKKPDINARPRNELAKDIRDARMIYQKDGVYTPEIRNSLKDVIKMNKDLYPDIFRKTQE